jgi:hypothetical protein
MRRLHLPKTEDEGCRAPDQNEFYLVTTPLADSGAQMRNSLSKRGTSQSGKQRRKFTRKISAASLSGNEIGETPTAKMAKEEQAQLK